MLEVEDSLLSVLAHSAVPVCLCVIFSIKSGCSVLRWYCVPTALPIFWFSVFVFILFLLCLHFVSMPVSQHVKRVMCKLRCVVDRIRKHFSFLCDERWVWYFMHISNFKLEWNVFVAFRFLLLLFISMRSMRCTVKWIWAQIIYSAFGIQHSISTMK